jgi:hypothetical protein
VPTRDPKQRRDIGLVVSGRTKLPDKYLVVRNLEDTSMQPDLIRQTINMLEAVGMEFVANRDFKLVTKADKAGTTYALGVDEMDYGDNVKNVYSVYKFVRKGGFEYNDRFYPQEFYTEVEPLKLSSYVKPQEALDAFDSWIQTH